MSQEISVTCPYCSKVQVVKLGGVNQYYESIVRCANKECDKEFAL